MNIKPIGLFALLILTACSQEEAAIPATTTPEPATAAVTAPEPIYEIEQVVGNLYRARSDNHYTVFLLTPDGTILADPLNLAFANWLKAQLAERFNTTVRYVLYSHHHWDHASGAAAFADTAEIIGHENMLADLAMPLPANYVVSDRNGDGAIQRDEAGGGMALYFDRLDENGDGSVTGAELNRDILPPTITYTDVYPVYLVNREVRMVYAGDNHSDDGTMLFFTEEAVGFGVDWLTVKTLPRTFSGKSLDNWIGAVDRMAGLGISRVVPGHGEMGRLEDLKALGQFFKDLRDAANLAVAAGVSREEFQKTLSLEAYKDWDGYDTLLAGDAGEAYDLALLK